MVFLDFIIGFLSMFFRLIFFNYFIESRPVFPAFYPRKRRVFSLPLSKKKGPKRVPFINKVNDYFSALLAGACFLTLSQPR